MSTWPDRQISSARKTPIGVSIIAQIPTWPRIQDSGLGAQVSCSRRGSLVFWESRSWPRSPCWSGNEGFGPGTQKSHGCVSGGNCRQRASWQGSFLVHRFEGSSHTSLGTPIASIALQVSSISAPLSTWHIQGFGV